VGYYYNAAGFVCMIHSWVCRSEPLSHTHCSHILLNFNDLCIC